MKEDSLDDLKKKIQQLEARNKLLEKEIREYIRAEDVMVAAGVVSKHKVEQAHEIVRSLNE